MPLYVTFTRESAHITVSFTNTVGISDVLLTNTVGTSGITLSVSISVVSGAVLFTIIVGTLVPSSMHPDIVTATINSNIANIIYVLFMLFTPYIAFQSHHDLI